MKIALLADHFEPRVGGIEVHVADLARHLAAHGHEVSVITTVPGNDRIGAVRVLRIPASLLPGVQILWHPGPLLTLRQLLIAEHFDVLHCHGSVVSPLAFTALGLAFRLRIPCVLTIHSYWNTATWNLRALSWVWPWNHTACRLTGVSRFIADRVALAAGRNDVTVLPNGIDTTSWEVPRRPGPGLRVTSVLRLNWKKQPHELLRAFAAVAQQIEGGETVRFTVIGDGPRRAKLEQKARRFGIAEQVEFLGFQPREKIREIFSTTDVFAHPTRNEAFGIAVLEACVARLPVVAMNHGGIRDLVEPSCQGFLADNRTEFVEHLRSLLQNAALRRQMAEAPREHLRQFDWNRVTERHFEVYAAAQRGVGRKPNF